MSQIYQFRSDILNATFKVDMTDKGYMCLIGDNGEGKSVFLKDLERAFPKEAKLVSSFFGPIARDIVFKDKTFRKHFWEMVSILEVSFKDRPKNILSGSDYLKLSKGLQTIVDLTVGIVVSSRKLILIDDVEKHLSMEKQKLLDAYFTYAINNLDKKFIMTTHSPFVFDNDIKYFTCHLKELELI